tara:strand:+ start:4996 stop:5688 length:693 start_codon:yes stop_codon:yes gene_type:complete
MRLLVIIIIIAFAYQIFNTNLGDDPKIVISRLPSNIIKNKIENINVINSKNDFETILEVSKDKDKDKYGTAYEEHIINAINKNDVFKKLQYNNELRIVLDFSNEYYILAVNNKLPIESFDDFSNKTNLKLGIEEYSDLLFCDIARQHNLYLGVKESTNYIINLIYKISDKQSLLKNNELDVIFITNSDYETLKLTNYKIIDIPYMNKLPKFIHRDNKKLYKKIMLFTNNL